MNYTSKEDSIRLKELGFECKHNAVIAVNPNGKVITTTVEAEILILMSATKECYPAYTSDQLFEWLREWINSNSEERFMEIQEDGMVVSDWGIKDMNQWHDHKTNLTDLLAKAVIWIKEQENEC